MARLSAPASRLGVMRFRLGSGAMSQAERSRHRDRTQGWRGWYKSARWRRLRLKVLRRDSHVCQATGVALIGAHPAPDSPVIDHKRPHRGDPDLFWDEDNLWAVSKAWHDGVKQRLEASGRL